MSAQTVEYGTQVKDPGWGELWSTPSTPDYVTSHGVAVWMWRNGQRVRFYDARGHQVGPEHANVMPAICWAAGQAWIDPTAPLLSLACIDEVRTQTAERRHRALRRQERSP